MNPLKFFAIVASVALVFVGLVIGKKLLIPLVLAFLIWYMINALTMAISHIPLGGRTLPKWLCFALALSAIGAAATLLVQLVSNNIGEVARLAPAYQRNLEGIIREVFTHLPVEEPPSLPQMLRKLDFAQLFSQLGKALGGLVGNTGILLIYLLFMFLEQKSFPRKFAALIENGHQREQVLRMLRQIDMDISIYLGIKTFTSSLTCILSFALMALVGLDLAMFWGLVIFLFNYIPTIGSIVATIFPSLVALVQFESIGPFFVVALGITALQVLIGNILEPRLLGNTLNLSPLVIILSLSLWGLLWGVTGMILCVPITVILMLVFSHFPRTRPIAALLSREGTLKDV